MKVLIIVPTKDEVEKECWNSLINQDYKDYSVLISIMKKEILNSEDGNANKYANIVRNRNFARKMALATDAEFFLWIDSDVVIPKNALSELMLQALNKDKIRYHIIGGYYKLTDNQYNAGKWIADNILINLNQIIPSISKVDKICLGCCLMSREVLEKIEFEQEARRFNFDKDNKTAISACECLAFAVKAQDLGYNLWMDGSVVCQHIKKERFK